MSQSTTVAARGPFDAARDQLRNPDGLPFLQLLARPLVEAACRRCGHRWRQRLYTPWVTLTLFLSQLLADDHSCDDAVDRFQKARYEQGLPAVGVATGSYCEARNRLPEAVVWDLVRQTGHALLREAPPAWLFHGRPVKVLDGSTVLMPDTAANQAVYPQQKSQAPGLGFPIARLLVIFSLAVGTVLEAAVGPYQGKQTSELALLRQVLAEFQSGDIALADRFFCSYWALAAWQRRGVDVVVRLHQCRTADFRRGRRLGREDHLITWRKPQQVPDWMSRAEYDSIPATITVRELRVRVRDPTKRVRSLVVVTTLTDPKTYRPQEIGALYRQRWHAELDLRSLKAQMKLEMLRTKTPAMVRKELATGFLAYNLIRGVMAAAARTVGIKPRALSFQGSLHTVRSFEEGHLYDPAWIAADLPRLLELVGQKRLAARPDRSEPRAVKRRPKPHPLLKMPRKAARRLIKRGIIPYSKA